MLSGAEVDRGWQRAGDADAVGRAGYADAVGRASDAGRAGQLVHRQQSERQSVESGLSSSRLLFDPFPVSQRITY